MTSFKGLLETCKTNLFKTYSNDAGKMLLHTATLGWIFSAAGQIFGIVTNDKVSKKQKKPIRAKVPLKQNSINEIKKNRFYSNIKILTFN